MPFGDAPRLRALALVLDLGSISGAANVLGYTQSAVSQQLAALEREVGTALVDRSQRPLRATPAGELLRPHVERVLAALGGADAAVEDLSGGMRRLRLAAFTSALSSFVPAAVRDLRRAQPDLVVQVLQLETQEAIERLRGGDADLAVVHHMPGIAVPETAGLRRRRLLVDDLYVVLPEGHPLARRDEVSVTDLEAEPLILPRRDTPAGRFRSVVEHLCAEAGFAPRVAYELDDLPAAQAFVAAGIAVVPMHGMVLATLPPGAKALPLAERPAGSRTIEALAPAGATTSVVDDLLERLAEAALAYALRRLRGDAPEPRPRSIAPSALSRT
jgi:DNA-binding transcriptional LysR family regulator